MDACAAVVVVGRRAIHAGVVAGVDGGVQSGHGSRPLRQAGVAIGAGAQPRQQGFGHQLGVRYLRTCPVAPNPTTVALGTSVAIRCTTSQNAGRLWSP